tara:strand:+ start:339 stop:1076 length:738 start_codon:yes stop_codon:yes gene_type:complete
MNKNIVVITAMAGLVDISYKEYCLNTWKYWCDKNDVQLFVLDEPLTDTSLMKPTWQRWHVFDVLDANNIDYNQVALIDVDTMIKWDAPNFFEETNGQLSVGVDNDNVGWVKQSIDGYQKYFKDVHFDWTTYFNCGVIVLSKQYKPLCKQITDFWYANQEQLIHDQTTIRKGTDQTPVNYITRQSGFAINYLDKKWNLTHLNRKEILQNFMFVDCGYIWHFNGFDKELREDVMRQTWNTFKRNYEN